MFRRLGYRGCQNHVNQRNANQHGCYDAENRKLFVGLGLNKRCNREAMCECDAKNFNSLQMFSLTMVLDT